MKKILKIFLVLMFATFAICKLAVSAEANLPGESSSFENTEMAPKALYVRNCARCHGADGKSQTTLGQNLNAADLTVDKGSVDRSIRIITKGRGEMPGFGKTLTKNQIASIANYIQSL